MRLRRRKREDAWRTLAGARTSEGFEPWSSFVGYHLGQEGRFASVLFALPIELKVTVLICGIYDDESLWMEDESLNKRIKFSLVTCLSARISVFDEHRP